MGVPRAVRGGRPLQEHVGQAEADWGYLILGLPMANAGMGHVSPIRSCESARTTVMVRKLVDDNDAMYECLVLEILGEVVRAADVHQVPIRTSQLMGCRCTVTSCPQRAMYGRAEAVKSCGAAVTSRGKERPNVR